MSHFRGALILEIVLPVAGCVNIFTIPWGGIEVNGNEGETAEMEKIIKKGNDRLRCAGKNK